MVFVSVTIVLKVGQRTNGGGGDGGVHTVVDLHSLIHVFLPFVAVYGHRVWLCIHVEEDISLHGHVDSTGLGCFSLANRRGDDGGRSRR